MVSDADYQAAVEFLYREARLADEARYAEWHALWTEDGVYWVPATTDPAASSDQHISHIYDNRARIDTRVKLLQTGHRYSQVPPSPMRRLISNIEVERAEDGDLVVGSNFILRAVHPGEARDALVGGAHHPPPAPRRRRAPDEPQDGGADQRRGAAAQPRLPDLSQRAAGLLTLTRWSPGQSDPCRAPSRRRATPSIRAGPGRR